MIDLFVRGEGLEKFVLMRSKIGKKQLVKVKTPQEDMRAFVRLELRADAYIEYQEKCIQDLKYKIMHQKTDDILAEMETEVEAYGNLPEGATAPPTPPSMTPPSPPKPPMSSSGGFGDLEAEQAQRSPGIKYAPQFRALKARYPPQRMPKPEASQPAAGGKHAQRVTPPGPINTQLASRRDASPHCALFGAWVRGILLHSSLTPKCVIMHVARLSTRLYMSGTRTSVRTVATPRPKITATAIGAHHWLDSAPAMMRGGHSWNSML